MANDTEKKTYSVHDKITFTGMSYTIVISEALGTNMGDHRGKILLLDGDFNRWTDAKEVRNMFRISEEEFRNIIGENEVTEHRKFFH